MALNFLKEVEGLRLKQYDDGTGVMTIGYGHTGPELPLEVTPEEAAALLEDDIERIFMSILPSIKVKIKECQLAACISLAFNIGPRNFKESTLLKKLNKEDFKGAVAEFPRWIYASNKRVEGLLNRRHKEMDLFNKEDLCQ